MRVPYPLRTQRPDPDRGPVRLLVILVLETVATVLLLDRSPVEAFYAATQAIVTVGPDQAVDHGPAKQPGQP